MFTLPELPYAYNALEPYIDEKTMQIHHDKHHAAYIEKLNAALKDLPELLNMPIIEILKDIHTLVPEAQRQAVINHGGGHANHTFFWEIMCPNSKKVPEGPLYEAITNTFDSFEKFKEAFALAGVGRFGSGWAWLVLNKGALEITSTANQDSPLMQGMVPLLGVDVWEHAYYLHYQNRRPEYIEAWWNVVHWEKVEELYTNAV